ncbi:MAG: short-chain dehydrogenase/reductase [Rhodoglobus sp.]|nr:short-chain dehydrogenase/reductase [Rhodoglobus sp.]
MVNPTILITGATDGLGLAVAHRLAGQGARVILHGRDQAKLDSAAHVIATQERVDAPATVIADFASLASVHQLPAQIEALTDHLDVLVNNAGIGSGLPEGRERQVSADGYELRFAVNYLAGFDLTLRLLPLLRAAEKARIVFVSSLGQVPIDFDDPQIERDYDGSRAYRQSKLAQVTFGMELAARLGDAPITVTSLHPSTFMPTKIVTANGNSPIDTLEAGTDATVRLAIDPALDGVTAQFFDRLAPARADEQAYDTDTRRRLWELSLELTGAPDFQAGSTR